MIKSSSYESLLSVAEISERLQQRVNDGTYVYIHYASIPQDAPNRFWEWIVNRLNPRRDKIEWNMNGTTKIRLRKTAPRNTKARYLTSLDLIVSPVSGSLMQSQIILQKERPWSLAYPLVMAIIFIPWIVNFHFFVDIKSFFPQISHMEVYLVILGLFVTGTSVYQDWRETTKMRTSIEALLELISVS